MASRCSESPRKPDLGRGASATVAEAPRHHPARGSGRTPPFYYMLAWGWAKLFGTGEVGLRSLSALAGTLTIPAAYAAGRALSSRRAGLIAAALFAVNPLLVWYSQEARAYALLALLC